MASLLTPYLNFGDNAREALEFYREVFGGELTVNTFGEFGMAGPRDADHIMHGQLKTPLGFTLMAADTPEGMAHSSGTNITVCLSGDDVEQLRGYFAKLSEGGNVFVPLERQIWGDEYGRASTGSASRGWPTSTRRPDRRPRAKTTSRAGATASAPQFRDGPSTVPGARPATRVRLWRKDH